MSAATEYTDMFPVNTNISAELSVKKALHILSAIFILVKLTVSGYVRIKQRAAIHITV